MIYKERLRKLRENKNMTQEELGKLIDCDKKAYNHFETEYTIIPIKHLITISNYFNVSIDYIFKFTNVTNYNNITEINIEKSGLRLKEIRKENKITQDKLSDILKIDRTTLSKYEKGVHIISTAILYTICKKYKISADYLLGKTDEPKYIK